MKKKILIVEDERDLVAGLKLNLEAEGYEVDGAFDGETGLRKALAEGPNLVILDIMLPGMSGLDVCRELRRNADRVPILMLTAKGDEVDKVVGLEMGADDYLTKPFSVRELLARVKALLRRSAGEEKSPPAVFPFGDVEVDFAHFKVRRGEREFDLTALEVDILRYLVAHQGEVVSREALLDKVWGYEKFPTTRTVDNHILKLRKKIEADPSRPRHIFSIYG
ncbi:MAG: response regulator transcription factor, partial [Candidatus Aminicenantes bacterium]|nr:response regulator transcription factor [Candidatus Aminicenantes bacterium]